MAEVSKEQAKNQRAAHNGYVLERDAILRDVLKPRLPYQRDVAGVGSLESPRQEGRDGIASN